MSRRIVELNSDTWRVGQSPADTTPERANWAELDRVDGWLPATVPGNVRADLMRASRLPDLTLGRNALAAHWVDDHCWWLTRDFECSPAPGERVHLVLRGVDYISDSFLNGRHLGRHEGMFSPQVHDVTGLLQSHNRLAVRILGNRWLPRDRSTPWTKLLSRVEGHFNGMPDRFPDRRDTLKCQMGFGWDFAPSLPPMGIWDDVFLVVSQAAFIPDVMIRQKLAENGAELTIRVEVDVFHAASARLRCTLSGETFAAEPLVVERSVKLGPGANQYTVELEIPQPHLWWPWDHGDPDLYDLSIQVWTGERLSDSISQTVGLRQINLDGWTLRVNGRRVYARGANWVPADILPGRVGDDDYRELLDLARQANMNTLRVWGGGLREKRAFYDRCNQLGILVWQELPLACAFLTRLPRTPDYLQLAEAEARAIVCDLRNHPCLALWCSGNEFDPGRNELLVAALRHAVEAEDPTRPFLAASPSDGDSHNWGVWHQFQPPSAYRDDEGAFASEFGLQAPPDAETLRRFIPAEELWPPGPAWTFHGAGLEKLWRYARPFLSAGQMTDVSLEAFVEASQHAQAHGLQIAIEHYRRRKAQGCNGALLWQLNEPWPAVSWALLDYYRQPKPAYEVVRRIFHPLLVSADYALRRYQAGERFEADVWLVNDLGQAFPGCELEVALRDATGQKVHHLIQQVDVAADCAQIVARFVCSLPAGGSWRLACRLIRDGETLTANEYDLSVCDDIQPTRSQRLWARITGLVIPS